MKEWVNNFLCNKIKIEESPMLDSKFPDYDRLQIRINLLQEKYDAAYFKTVQLEDKIQLFKLIQVLYPSRENPERKKPTRERFSHIYQEFFRCPTRDEEGTMEGDTKRIINELRNQCVSIEDMLNAINKPSRRIE